jgi:hypothetical protein
MPAAQQQQEENNHVCRNPTRSPWKRNAQFQKRGKTIAAASPQIVLHHSIPIGI